MTVPAPREPGLVVAAHGRQVIVETPEGRRVLCQTRGKKSDLVVGDRFTQRMSTGDTIDDTLVAELRAVEVDLVLEQSLFLPNLPRP